jgi:UDP-N-acetylglucosamine--N-acetylmuramyl-(pentapeptide) pyrophosphoryl-undecaprenol N-acetylglucosamine transferase
VTVINQGARPQAAPVTWAVIAGGGTGGHVYPGVAVARALVERGHDPATLRFVGARRGLEAKTRALEGFPVTLLPGRGLDRTMSGRSAVANLEATAGAITAIAMALVYFSKWRPAVVISLGGYASLGCVVAAFIWRVPIVVVNVDAVPGAVNRLAARVAAASAVASADVRLARAVPTGVPVRAEMLSIDRSPEGRRAARDRLGLPGAAKVVAVSGGSLGSLRINRATLELARLWAGRSDVAIRHVVGRRDWQELENAPVPEGPLTYQRVEYEEDMVSFYGAADVALQRAGANTVAELALAGVPAVLVPLPRAPGGHQGANARSMASAGGAVVIQDDDLDGLRLAEELDALLEDPAVLVAMGEAATSLGRPFAAEEVARLVEERARRSATAQVVVKGGAGAA